MTCFRIVLAASLAILALTPANLANVSWPAGLHLVALAAVPDGTGVDEPATSAMLLGGALILMIAGRCRRP